MCNTDAFSEVRTLKPLADDADKSVSYESAVRRTTTTRPKLDIPSVRGEIFKHVFGDRRCCFAWLYRSEFLERTDYNEKYLDMVFRYLLYFGARPDSRFVAMMLSYQTCDITWNASGWFHDLTVEGIEPNPGPAPKKKPQRSQRRPNAPPAGPAKQRAKWQAKPRQPRSNVAAQKVNISLGAMKENEQASLDVRIDKLEERIDDMKHNESVLNGEAPTAAPLLCADTCGVKIEDATDESCEAIVVKPSGHNQDEFRPPLVAEKLYCNVVHCEAKWYIKLLAPIVGAATFLVSPRLSCVAALATALGAKTMISHLAMWIRERVVRQFAATGEKGKLIDLERLLNLPRTRPMSSKQIALSIFMRAANSMTRLVGGTQIIGVAQPVKTVPVAFAEDVRHSSSNSSKLDSKSMTLQEVHYFNFDATTETVLVVDPMLAAECCAYSCLTDKMVAESLRRKAYSNTQLNLPVLFRGAITADTTVLAEIMKTPYTCANSAIWDLNGQWGSEVTWLVMAIASLTLVASVPLIRQSITYVCTQPLIAIGKYTCIVWGQCCKALRRP